MLSVCCTGEAPLTNLRWRPITDPTLLRPWGSNSELSPTYLTPARFLHLQLTFQLLWLCLLFHLRSHTHTSSYFYLCEDFPCPKTLPSAHLNRPHDPPNPNSNLKAVSSGPTSQKCPHFACRMIFFFFFWCLIRSRFSEHSGAYLQPEVLIFYDRILCGSQEEARISVWTVLHQRWEIEFLSPQALKQQTANAKGQSLKLCHLVIFIIWTRRQNKTELITLTARQRAVAWFFCFIRVSCGC